MSNIYTRTIDLFRERIRVNNELKLQVQLLNKALDSAEGIIKTLRDWNQQLQHDRDEYKDVIFKKYGLVSQAGSEIDTNPNPVRVAENWLTAKRKLEAAHRVPTSAPELRERQEYWAKKLEEAESSNHKD